MPYTPSQRRIFRRASYLGAVIGLCLAALVWWLNRDIEAQDPILATQTPIPSAQYFRAAPDESMLKMIVHSRFGDIDGLFQLGESSVELEPAGDGWYVVANLIFDARTLDIGSDQLNTAMRRALEVDKYPSGIFVARSSTPITDLSVAQQVDLMGQMELHGSVQDYTIVTVVEINGDKLTLSAQMTIDSAQFGISIPALIAENDLDTDMQVVAYRAEKGTP